MSGDVEAVVFDLGGVLVDWNPRYLYRRIFDDEAVMERFLALATPSAWNHRMDEGVPFAEAIAERKTRFPEWAVELDAYWARWPEMLGGAIDDTVRILEELGDRGVPLYALTNWSAETFPFARARYAFLDRFEDIVVSGIERVAKPSPALYRRLTERNRLDPAQLLFVDDKPENVRAARALGWAGVVFEDPPRLRRALVERGLLGP